MPSQIPPDRRTWLALRLYRLALHAYPAAFRRTFGHEMWQTFRDAYEEASAAGGTAVPRLWLRMGADVLRSAPAERINAMRPAILIASIMTGITFIVALAASLNLYFLEDNSPLTSAAYAASPLLRLSYDGAYLSALVAGVAICAVVGYALIPSRAAVAVGYVVLALVVALGGFGGLLVRHPANFLGLFAVYAALAVVCYVVGQAAASRLAHRMEARAASVVGGCVGVAVALLANLVAVVPHTVALNPVSHTLYMQGQIAGTHYNALLIGMAIEFATVALCIVSLIAAVRTRGQPTRLATN